MKKSIVVSILVVAVALMSCGKGDSKTEMTIQELHAAHGVPVEVAVAQSGVVRHIEKVSGTAEGIRQSFLTNPLAGTLQRISVKEGQSIREGDIVAVMYFEDGSPRSVAQTSYDHASKMYERMQRLHEKGAATQTDVEAAKIQYENASRGLRGASAAEFVRAPFAGVVLEIFQSAGTKIDAKTVIAQMADFSRVLINAKVNQLNINKYAAGQNAFVLINGQDSIWGKVTSVAVGGSLQNHAFHVTFDFPNPQNKLKVGMFKEVFVVVEEKKDVVSVPADVVVYKGGKPSVYVVEGNEAKLREVELGINSGSDIEIISGVKEGEKFVVFGASLLSDGVKVKILE